MEEPVKPKIPVIVDLFALMDYASKIRGSLLIPGQVAPLQGATKKQAPMLKNVAPPPKPVTGVKAPAGAVLPAVQKVVVPTKALPISKIPKIVKPPTVVPTEPTATLGDELGEDEAAAPEHSDEGQEGMCTEAAPVMADPTITDPSTEADMGGDEENMAEETDLGDSSIDGDEPPEEPMPDPRRRPLPPGAKLSGNFKIRGSRDTGSISPPRKRMGRRQPEPPQYRLFACDDVGRCEEIDPDDLPPPPAPARKRPKKR